jgi:hypothetical protein
MHLPTLPAPPSGALAGLLLVRGLSVVWAPSPWPVAAAGAAYVAAIAAGATLPGLLLLLVFGGRGGGASATGAAEPLLVGEAAKGGAGPPAVTARVKGAGGGGGGALSLEVPLEGGGADALPLRQGRPDLRQLLGGWLAGLGGLPRGEGAGGGRLQVACYAMGPEGLLAEAQLLCHELNGGRRGGAKSGGAAAPFLRFVQKTHNL